MCLLTAHVEHFLPTNKISSYCVLTPSLSLFFHPFPTLSLSLQGFHLLHHFRDRLNFIIQVFLQTENWVVQRLSKILMREDTQGSKKGGLKDFLSSLWVSTHLPFCILLKKQTNKGLDPCCNLFTPKAKGELERVTLVSEPVWEGLQFAHQHSCCRAVWNGAPGWPECNNWEHQAGHFVF